MCWRQRLRQVIVKKQSHARSQAARAGVLQGLRLIWAKRMLQGPCSTPCACDGPSNRLRRLLGEQAKHPLRGIH